MIRLKRRDGPSSALMLRIRLATEQPPADSRDEGDTALTLEELSDDDSPGERGKGIGFDLDDGAL